MPRYFLDLPGEGTPIAWNPHDGPRPERADTRYFSAVFIEMERTLRDPDIDVHLTWDPHWLPDYGANVVAVVLGDEVGQIPRYSDRVRATFKGYGVRPVLGAGPLRDPSLTGLMALVQCGIRWGKWLPGGGAYLLRAGARRLRGGGPPAPLFTIPIGTYNQVELPVVPIADRPTHVSFAGSLEHRASFAQHFGAPKTLARREMLSALERLSERRPDLRLDVHVTADFGESVSMSPGTYSRSLMDSKICLAPRGTAIETFRVLEGLRYGCVVVADRLPKRWFLAGAPILQVDRWNELDELLDPVLDDPAALERLHVDSLRWWRDSCSEQVIGAYMAKGLNALGSARVRT
jgi:hypothetical protein